MEVCILCPEVKDLIALDQASSNLMRNVSTQTLSTFIDFDNNTTRKTTKICRRCLHTHMKCAIENCGCRTQRDVNNIFDRESRNGIPIKISSSELLLFKARSCVADSSSHNFLVCNEDKLKEAKEATLRAKQIKSEIKSSAKLRRVRNKPEFDPDDKTKSSIRNRKKAFQNDLKNLIVTTSRGGNEVADRGPLLDKDVVFFYKLLKQGDYWEKIRSFTQEDAKAKIDKLEKEIRLLQNRWSQYKPGNYKDRERTKKILNKAKLNIEKQVSLISDNRTKRNLFRGLYNSHLEIARLSEMQAQVIANAAPILRLEVGAMEQITIKCNSFYPGPHGIKQERKEFFDEYISKIYSNNLAPFGVQIKKLIPILIILTLSVWVTSDVEELENLTLRYGRPGGKNFSILYIVEYFDGAPLGKRRKMVNQVIAFLAKVRYPYIGSIIPIAHHLEADENNKFLLSMRRNIAEEIEEENKLIKEQLKNGLEKYGKEGRIKPDRNLTKIVYHLREERHYFEACINGKSLGSDESKLLDLRTRNIRQVLVNLSQKQETKVTMVNGEEIKFKCESLLDYGFSEIRGVRVTDQAAQIKENNNGSAGSTFPNTYIAGLNKDTLPNVISSNVEEINYDSSFDGEKHKGKRLNIRENISEFTSLIHLKNCKKRASAEVPCLLEKEPPYVIIGDCLAGKYDAPVISFRVIEDNWLMVEWIEKDLKPELTPQDKTCTECRSGGFPVKKEGSFFLLRFFNDAIYAELESLVRHGHKMGCHFFDKERIRLKKVLIARWNKQLSTKAITRKQYDEKMTRMLESIEELIQSESLSIFIREIGVNVKGLHNSKASSWLIGPNPLHNISNYVKHLLLLLVIFVGTDYDTQVYDSIQYKMIDINLSELQYKFIIVMRTIHAKIADCCLEIIHSMKNNKFKGFRNNMQRLLGSDANNVLLYSPNIFEAISECIIELTEENKIAANASKIEINAFRAERKKTITFSLLLFAFLESRKLFFLQKEKVAYPASSSDWKKWKLKEMGRLEEMEVISFNLLRTFNNLIHLKNIFSSTSVIDCLTTFTMKSAELLEEGILACTVSDQTAEVPHILMAKELSNNYRLFVDHDKDKKEKDKKDKDDEEDDEEKVSRFAPMQKIQKIARIGMYNEFLGYPTPSKNDKVARKGEKVMPSLSDRFIRVVSSHEFLAKDIKLYLHKGKSIVKVNGKRVPLVRVDKDARYFRVLDKKVTWCRKSKTLKIENAAAKAKEDELDEENAEPEIIQLTEQHDPDYCKHCLTIKTVNNEDVCLAHTFISVETLINKYMDFNIKLQEEKWKQEENAEAKAKEENAEAKAKDEKKEAKKQTATEIKNTLFEKQKLRAKQKIRARQKQRAKQKVTKKSKKSKK